MKNFMVVASLLFQLVAYADDDGIYPKHADAFLSKVGCSFSAYVVHKGRDNYLIKTGQVSSLAICIDSYHTNGARSEDFCWLRAIDLKRGGYVVSNDRGLTLMGRPCSKDSILELVRRPYVSSQLQFKGTNGQWNVATDQFQIKAEFLKIVK